MNKLPIFGLLIASTLLINILPNNQTKAYSQSGGVDFLVSGQGCNAKVVYNSRTNIVQLTPGLELNSSGETDRTTCTLRVTSPNNDKFLVPVAVKGNTKNRGGT